MAAWWAVRDGKGIFNCVVASLVSNRCGCVTAGYREKKIFEEDVAEGLYTKWLVVPVQVPVPETAQPSTCAAHHISVKERPRHQRCRAHAFLGVPQSVGQCRVELESQEPAF